MDRQKTKIQIKAYTPSKSLILVYIAIMLMLFEFATYAYMRANGSLVSEDQWLLRKINHGPWRWTWQGIILFISPFLIPILSLFIGSIEWMSSQKLRYFRDSIGYALAQFFVLLIPLITLYWTID